MAAESIIDVKPRDVRRPTEPGRAPSDQGDEAAEFWLHPDGKHGYLSTIGDRIYAIDLSDPTKPAITDSVVVDARYHQRRNDDRRREVRRADPRGISSVRKNGIVVLSFEDPAHPQADRRFRRKR